MLRTENYRVLYVVKVGNAFFTGELNLSTEKERWEIDHEAVISAHLAKRTEGKAVFDRIIDIERLA